MFNLLRNCRLFFQSQYLTSKVEGASFRTSSQTFVYFFILAILMYLIVGSGVHYLASDGRASLFPRASWPSA